MITPIKTAHGYLSIQPTGKIEFRKDIGAWEVFDFEGLVMPTPPVPQPEPPQPEPPKPDPPKPPDPGYWLGIPPSQTATYVSQVKAYLLGHGANLSGPCGAFEITKNVAWGLREQSIGLVSKPTGNNCAGYSVDYLCWLAGDGVDILGDAGGNNTPQWAYSAREFEGQGRWRPPVQP